MAAKVTYLGILLLIFFNPAPGLADTKKYTSLQYFKNYALSTCIADGFQSEEVVKDARRRQGVILSLVTFHWKHIQRLPYLAENFLQENTKAYLAGS